MGRIENIEMQSSTEYCSATFTGDDGQAYEIVFTRNYDAIGDFEWKEVVNVEKAGAAVDLEDPVWEEIQDLLV